MTIPHTRPAFDIMGYLKGCLEDKRKVRAGSVSEIERLEQRIIGTDKEIAEIEAAITKMESP